MSSSSRYGGTATKRWRAPVSQGPRRSSRSLEVAGLGSRRYASSRDSHDRASSAVLSSLMADLLDAIGGRVQRAASTHLSASERIETEDFYRLISDFRRLIPSSEFGLAARP